ncbi:lysM and putative peptidoglycan-binding domain-containing protein 2 [Cavia porcellus]|uniref:LysM and putative peptidoglycan-binding domain-containing protein 2 n=1 Tax=Cavia porcellus TaxID=10141 RepID=A0A286XEM0_CAVPO|nr:lysM and putative peptidoglycan-binding domain-containing protein 2 isoform X1 [Cavia porcellus]
MAAPPPASEDAALSLGLARTKARSYGSTGRARALGHGDHVRLVQHRVRAGDTLAGLALKYGVTMEQIKRANKLFTSDCIFLKKTLNIPVVSEKPLLFNGLNSPDSPENEAEDSSFPPGEQLGMAEDEFPPPSPQESAPRPEEVSARDFLDRLDLQIKLSTQAAQRLKREPREKESPYAASLYHS